VAKVEWHPGELVQRVGFIVANMARVAENVVAFYNKRGSREQRIKDAGADCVHISGCGDDLVEVTKKLSPRYIIGAGDLETRDDACRLAS
jgi:hypothetical protein